MGSPMLKLSGEMDAACVSSDVAVDVAEAKELMRRLRSSGSDSEDRVAAAREIRRLTRTSTEHRRMLSGAVGPLAAMLRWPGGAAAEAAVLALLNLAVKDERNKINIVNAGALEPIIGFLQSTNSSLQEYAAATLLTLTASSTAKSAISTAGAIPLLVMVLRDGNPQAKVDAVTALYNLSTLPGNIKAILSAKPVPPLISILKSCRRSSKIAEKCMALLELLLRFDEGRTALTTEAGGVLVLVEVLEQGSVLSKEHAVGALLTMCESDRSKYKEFILKEGAIPGLLELTVRGTPTSQPKARALLELLRDSPYPRPELQVEVLDNIVSNIVAHVDREDCTGRAKKMLAEMVQVSMEQSLKHMQKRALMCTSSKKPSGVPSK